MKIYISAPVKHRPDLKLFQKALAKLEKDGHKIVDVYKDESYPIKEVTQFVSKFKESEKAIRECDLVIVEVTYPSRRVGFEIARALDERKVVIALNKKGSETESTATIAGNTAKNFLYREYDAQNVEEIMNEAITEAKNKLDTKFILIISPEIDKYLDWAADERRMHKAQIVRNAIEDVMKKDKEYNDFLEESGLAG